MRRGKFISGMFFYILGLFIFSSLLVMYLTPLHTPFLGEYEHAHDLDKAINSYFITGADEALLSLPPNERSHLSDVRKVLFYSIFAFIICVRLFLKSWNPKKGFRKKDVVKPTKYERFAILLSPFIFLQAVAFMSFSTSFEQFFGLFHMLLFPQGNYLFSYSSPLIQSYPASFFMSMTALVVTFVAIFALIFIVLYYWKKFIKQ